MTAPTPEQTPNPQQSPAAPRRRRMSRSALVLMLLAGTTLAGFAAGHEGFAATPPVESGPVNPPGAAPLAQVPDFANLVSQVRPAVVSITTHLKVSEAADVGAPQLPFPFNQPPFSNMQPQQEQAIEARGSGFIIDASGIIVTNNHVIKNAKSISVTLSNGTTLPAHLIGHDPRTDIALLKIDAGHKLPYIELGDSAKTRPGEWVVAMGNPFGLGGTVTAGIISAEGRDIGDGPYDQFIQVDAPINEGNSGGPLFTQNGKVIGINTAILSPSGGSVGIGFAIPSNMVKTVVAQLEAHGHVTRGYIGVEAQPVAGTMARALHLSDNSGALIAGVEPGTPADQAGLKPGDVIQSVNGEKIANPRELAVDVAAVKPGDMAHIGYLRDGKSHDVSFKVAELPNHIATNGVGTAHEQGRIGLALGPITPDARNQLSLPKDVNGALVRGVQPNSPADIAGIQAGDVIVGVGTEAVSSPGEAAHAIEKAEHTDHAVALRILRNGQPAFVAIDLGKGGNNQG